MWSRTHLALQCSDRKRPGWSASLPFHFHWWIVFVWRALEHTGMASSTTKREDGDGGGSCSVTVVLDDMTTRTPTIRLVSQIVTGF